MNRFDKKIAFVGGGNMAEAVLGGLIRHKTLDRAQILIAEKNPERCAYLQQEYQVETVSDNQEAARRSQTIFLAVKPQILNEVKEEIRPFLSENHLVISILAGTSRAKLAAALGESASIVRVMPNLPAQVGFGVSAITFPDSIAPEARDWVTAILRSVGEVVEVPESLQDVVTAVSGSGPGYMFYIAQHWIDAAVDNGLAEDIARRLVTETMAGSAELLRQRPDTPAELVRKVATPGGTTEAGLSALQQADFPEIIHSVVERATARSRELNQK